jgi:hypothetical protein
MIKLNKEIPKWKIIRRVIFILENKALLIKSIDTDGKPYSIFKKVVIQDKKSTVLNSEPFIFKDELGNIFDVILHFQGYYNEPELKLTLEKDKLRDKVYIMEYDPEKGVWDDVYAIENNI